MTRQSGADLLIKSLKKAGVDRAYGVPGEETAHLVEAMSSHGIDLTLCRHEQSAAFMASVHGRLTGRPAICLATLGPGATNLITGVADAQLDRAPLIAITGQAERARMGWTSHQVIDLETLFAPVTKLSRTLMTTEEIPGAAAEAVRLSTEGAPGAVHLSLPEDVAAQDAHGTPLDMPQPAPLFAGTEAIATAAKTLETAEMPIIVAGAGVLRMDATNALRTFADTHCIPVATTFMAKGVLPPRHELSLLTVGQPRNDYIDLALPTSDLIVAVGVDPVELSMRELTNDGEIPVLHIDKLPPSADPGWNIASAIEGDMRHALTALSQKLGGKRWDMSNTLSAVHEALHMSLDREISAKPTGPIAPQDICATLSKRLRTEDTVLSGVGLHKLWIARHVEAKRAGQVIIPNGLAGMGLALPGAMAAAQLQSTGRVIAICGDGDFLMNVQDMELAARLGLNVTVMVWEDGGYGLIEEKQDGDADLSFSNPVWHRLAAAFGWVHAPVSGLGELDDVLQAGLDCQGPVLISVPVDYATAGGMPGVWTEVEPTAA